MNRQELINRLVSRKLRPAADGKNHCYSRQSICICMAGPAKTPASSAKS